MNLMLYGKFSAMACFFIILMSGCMCIQVEPEYTVDEESHFVGVLTDNLLIDAEIQGFNNNEVYSAYEAQLLKFPDEEQLLSILGLNMENCIDMKTSPGNLYYSSEYFSDYLSQMIYAYPEMNNTTFDFRHLEYSRGKDLSFMNHADVIELTSKILFALGVRDTCNPTVYGLNLEDLVKMESTMLREGKITPPKNEDKVKIKEQWTQADEVYFITLDLALDNVTVFDGSIGNPETGDYSKGPMIDLCISSNGVEYIRLDAIYKIKQAKAQMPILPPSQAVEKIAQNYNNLIITSPMTITKGMLKYIPISTQSYDNYVMTPCWIFSVEEVVVYEDNTSIILTGNIIINALTGEEMI